MVFRFRIIYFFRIRCRGTINSTLLPTLYHLYFPNLVHINCSLSVLIDFSYFIETLSCIIPLKEAATVEQAAAGILYLASNKKSGNTTGASLAIAGGSNIPVEDRFIVSANDVQASSNEKQENDWVRPRL